MRGDLFNAVREWEEGVRAHGRPLKRQNRLLRTDAGGVNAAHLSCPHADGLTVADIDDGVRLDMLRDFPRELQVFYLRVGRRSLAHDLQVLGSGGQVILGLGEVTSGDALDDQRGGCLADFQQAQVFLASQDGECFLVETGGGDRFDEQS